MTELASNLLALARLDAGVTHLETDVLDLRLILSHVKQRVSALTRQHDITVTIAEAPEPVYVVGDRVLLEQATMILLDNAIKYNRPHGTVSLETSQHSQWAQIRVRDTGIGIGASNLAHIGERFYRVDTAHTRANGGAGLGVSIARGIAAAHHGILTFMSAPGQGTTAQLNIPAVVARTACGPDARTQLPKPSSAR
jgi:signal transduction histidine kinase